VAGPIGRPREDDPCPRPAIVPDDLTTIPNADTGTIGERVDWASADGWTFPPDMADYSGPRAMTLYQPTLAATGISWSRKKKCPRLFTEGKFSGRLHVWETQGTGPLSSDWRWNSGGSAAVTDVPL
jgi:hypothetical protein